MRDIEKKVADDESSFPRTTSVYLSDSDRRTIADFVERKYGGTIGVTTAIRIELMDSVRRQLKEMGVEEDS